MSKAEEIICPTCQTANRPERQECFVCGEMLASEDSEVTEASLEGRSPSPDSSDKESDEKWLDELAKLGGEDEKVPIDQAWPSPDWLEADEEPVDPADDLLNWLREEETSETDSVDVEEGDKFEEEHAADSVGETSVPTWLDDVEKDAVPDEEELETQFELVATGEVSEDELPDWLDDLALADEWSELGDEEEATEVSEEEIQNEESLPNTGPLGFEDDLTHVPERLATKTLPSWLRDQFPDLNDDRDETEEPGPDQLQPEFSEEDKRIDEMFQEEDVDSRQMAESEEELAARDGIVASEHADGFVERSEFDEQAKAEESLQLKAEDLLDEGVEEELDWFLDEAELKEQAPLTPLEEQEALLAGLQDVGEDQGGRPAEQVREIIEASEVEIDPAWLASLTTPEGEQADWESKVEESGPLSGMRGVLERPQAISLQELTAPGGAYTQSNGIDERTALLERLTQGTPTTGRLQGALDKSSATTWPRSILGLLLILFILTGWLAPFTEFQPGSSTTSSDIKSTVDNAAGKTALMAFDYAPAWGGELDLAADALLEDLADSGIKILAVSQSPAGIGMANLAFERNEDVDHFSLGFLPGEAVGIRNLAVCVDDIGQCENSFGMQLDPDTRTDLGNLSLVIVLAVEREELTRWIEQIGGIGEIEMIAAVTQSLAPVAKPYVASGQLVGVLAGPADIANYIESTNVNGRYLTEQASSLALANWLSIGVLVFALLFSGVSAAAGRNQQKSKVSKNV